ncbi:MAG: PD-(D/E)XK nuclease family protein [Candidatus Omnitrophica bacterium]|nr:PD-(D/E)XK nuclease family protein [Candidatus Omnitrophota bacterium]
MKRETKYKENVFSYSSIQDFLNCPYLYKLIYVDKNERYETMALKRGIEIHKLCEKLCNIQDPSEVKKIMEGWDKTEIERAIKYAEYFIDKEIANIDGKKAIEFYKKIKIGRGEYLEMHVDNIHFTQTGILRIMDIKTGGNIFTKEQLQNNLQLNLYAYIISNILPAIDVEIGIWYWDAGYNSFVKYNKDHDLINRLKYVINKIKETKKNGKWIKTANKYCSNCQEFSRCKPFCIEESYAYCKEMENFWHDKAEYKKIEMLNKMETIGLNKIQDEKFEYYLIEKKFTTIDKDDLLNKINDINILKEYFKPTKDDIYSLKQKGIEVKEIPLKTTKELRYKKILGETDE